MEKIKAAVIGCGRMGAFTSDLMKEFGPKCWFPLSHIEALNEHEEIFLEAICDSNESLLKKAGDLYDVKYRYSDSLELFDKHEIDLLTVATRTKDRYQIIKDGIASGVKAFHLEKPLCNSLQELNEIQSLVTDSKICLTYGTLRRYFKIYQKAKDLVDSGAFGKLLQIQVNFGHKPLFWGHPHSVDTILFFSGKRKLKYVQSQLSNLIFAGEKILESDPLVEQSNMFFDDGLLGSISKNPGSDVLLNCEKGVVIVESNGSQISTRAATQDSPYFEHSKAITDDCMDPQGTYSAIATLVENYKNKDYSKHHFIFSGQKILFGFVESHLNEGKVINFDKISIETTILGKTGNLYA